MTGSMRRIWLCADDYGIAPGVNRGIRQLILNGRLNATSVMMAAPHIDADEVDALTMLNSGQTRAAFGLHDFITGRHLANAAKVLLATCWLVSYGYLAEIFTSFYSGDIFERYMTVNRFTGPYGPVYWAMLTCNVLVPQLFWFRRVRRSVPLLFVLSLVINCGMWMERFLIVVTSLHRDYLPSAWGMFYPTRWDWITLFGSIALFVWLFLLFVRFLPAISIAEMRELVRETAKGEA